MIVCIDPGHGGKDPGAVDPVQPAEGDDIYTEEADIAYEIAVQTANALQRIGHQVKLTRQPNQFVSLAERCRIANQAKADAFVSIHLNAGRPLAAGFEAWSHPKSQRGILLGSRILDELAQAFPSWRNRGAKKGDFAVLRGTKMPAVLVECGFITNPDEERRLHAPEVQQKMGEAIARGINEWGKQKS